MNLFSFLKVVFVAGVAIATAGCSSSSDGGSGGSCTPPVVTGSPLFTSGTGSVHGAGTLPASVPNNQQLELLVETGNFTQGVLPSNLADQTLSCGTFTFTITQLDAGTYNLDYNIYDPRSQSTDPTFTGRSTNTFVVADGQSVEFNPTF